MGSRGEIMKWKVFLCALSVFLSRESWAISFDPEVPEDLKSQMEQDLSFVEGLQGENETPLHKHIFGQINGSGYKQFFDSRILRVGLYGCGDAAAVACVVTYFDENKMWLTENYTKFQHPQIARIMVIFHEARHSEGKNGHWMHANCPDPFVDENGKDRTSIWTGIPLAGEAGCDVTAYGSYGSSTIMLKNIAKNCTNCNEKVKMDADIYASDQLNRIIDPEAKQEMITDFGG